MIRVLKRWEFRIFAILELDYFFTIFENSRIFKIKFFLYFHILEF